MPIVLDTHVWVWWVTQDDRLSRRASQAIQRAVRGEGLTLSVISIWEVAKKVEKQQLILDRPVRDWVERACAPAGLSLTELTPQILVESCALPVPFHGDPADQMIVATARVLGTSVITKDRRLRDYPHVQTIW
jgi:PIN domain nuclease of toxin-antitoxin system